MAWVVLIVSGIFEAGWALSLKASEGLTRRWPSASFVVLTVISLGRLSWALRTRPVGPSFPGWTGLGAALSAVIAIVMFGEAVTVLKVVSLVLIIAGIVGLNLSESGTDDTARAAVTTDG